MHAITASRAEPMPIGELSRLSGVNIETIRYYERIKMLPAPRRTTSGRRVYSTTELRILAFIRRSRELGFSLNEIRALLRLGAPMTIQKGTAWKASPPTARRSVSIAFECRLGVADCLPDYVSAATDTGDSCRLVAATKAEPGQFGKFPHFCRHSRQCVLITEVRQPSPLTLLEPEPMVERQPSRPPRHYSKRHGRPGYVHWPAVRHSKLNHESHHQERARS